MGTYGRNLEFRVPPISEYRMARYAANATPLSGTGAAGTGTTGGGYIPLGAPVIADTAAGLDSYGRQVVKLATSADPSGDVPPPALGAGLAVYEWAPAAFAGTDPLLTTYSDLDYCPAGRAVQVVHGNHVKVVLFNTVAELFLGQRRYNGRNMVAGIGATPTVQIGNYLIPGQGDDVDGYWLSTATAAGAWMVITGIDLVRVSVEARMLF
jgi:hypothetical protein